MSKNMFLDKDGKLWRKTKNGVRVEVLDTMERLRDVLIMIHDGMGHRATGSCYSLFTKILGAGGFKAHCEAHTGLSNLSTI